MWVQIPPTAPYELTDVADCSVFFILCKKVKAMKNISEQIGKAVSLLKENLNDNVLGIYLYGSAVLGGLHPNSDIDILVIAQSSITRLDRELLTKKLMSISGKVGDTHKRPIELTIINIADISPWRFPPVCDYMYGEWLREELEAGYIPQSYAEPDAAILLWQAREHSILLYGAKVEGLIPPIPLEDIRRAILDSLPSLLLNIKGDERNTLLTLSRMWYTLETGKICPKHIAAQWALTKLPPALIGVLSKAIDGYLGLAEDQWDENDTQINELVLFMSNEIEKYRCI